MQKAARWNDIVATIGGRHAIFKNAQVGARESGPGRRSFILSDRCGEFTDGVERTGDPRDSKGKTVHDLPCRVAAEQVQPEEIE
jgi:hypothetical protein